MKNKTHRWRLLPENMPVGRPVASVRITESPDMLRP